MNVNSLKHDDLSYPDCLRRLYKSPTVIYYKGASPDTWIDLPKVTVIGSRKMTVYGQEVTDQITSALTKAGVVIISGLALGIDAVAHRAAIRKGGITVAVLATSPDKIYPASHRDLAEQILKTGGTILSENNNQSVIHKGSFIARNRIESCLADVVLITEAAVNSGTLHTARFALEQGKTVMAVPGNITSETSEGTNNLIKAGALPVTDVEDILYQLDIKGKKSKTKMVFRGTAEEEKMLKLLRSGIRDQELLAAKTQFAADQINSILTILEINGYIRSVGGGQWLAI